MGDKVDPNLVAPSRHAIFIRGLPGSLKVDEVRDYFCHDGHKCRVDFHSISDDKRRLFVALRFDSHEVARELKHRYHGKEVLGHEVEISWFKDLRKARAKMLDLQYPVRERERMRMGSGGGGGGMLRSGDRMGGPGGFRDQRYFNGPRKPFYSGGPGGGGGGGYMNRGGYRRPGFDRGGHFNRNSPPFHASRYRSDRIGMGGGGGFNRRRRSFSGGRSPRSSSRISDDYDSRSRSSLSNSPSPDRDHRDRPRSPSSIGSHSASGGMDSLRRRRRSSNSSSERRMRSNSRSTSMDEDSDRDSDSDDSDLARRSRRRLRTDSSSTNTPAPPLPSTAPGPTFPAGAAMEMSQAAETLGAASNGGDVSRLANYFEPITGTPVKSGGGIVITPFSASTMAVVAPNSAEALASIPTPSEMGDRPKRLRRTMSKSPNLAAEKRKKKKKKKVKGKRASRSPESVNRASSRSSHIDGADSKPQTPPDTGDEDDEAEEGQIKENIMRRAKRSGLKKKEKDRNEGDGLDNANVNPELSSSHTKLMKSKKSTIEKAYKKDCKTFATVVKVLISKNPDIEERLQASLREILQDIGQRCIEDLREYMRSLHSSEAPVGGVGASEMHSIGRESSADSYHRSGNDPANVRASVPRFDRQRAMAAAALEEGEAEESGGSSPLPQKLHARSAARNSFSARGGDRINAQ